MTAILSPEVLARPGSGWVFEEGTLRRLDGAPAAPDLQTASIHAALREFVLHPEFPCVGAKSAFHRGSYQFGLYRQLGADGSERLARDLEYFAESAPGSSDDFATFIACFEGPRDLTEDSFERLLWQQLQHLHLADSEPWPEGYASDPEDPHFAWSFHGVPFFVVGLSPASSRLARRFPFPAIVFNPHAQFERLRDAGQWKRMQEVIRDRDRELQGDINPALTEFGEESEARQYSGRPRDEDWVAPFNAEADGGDDAERDGD